MREEDKLRLRQAAMDMQEDSELYLKMMQNGQEKLKKFTEEAADAGSRLQLDPNDPMSASIREDTSLMAQITRDFNAYMEARIKNNHCSASEYVAKFIILHQFFEHSGYDDIHEFCEARRIASEEYRTRFSPFHPLRITADDDESVTLVTIPPVEKSPAMINGHDAMAVDQFIQFATFDQPAVARGAQMELNRAAMAAQANDQKELYREHIKNNKASLEVLRFFCPDHPALKELMGGDDKNEPASTEDQKKATAEPSVENGIVKTADGKTVVGNLDTDDIF